RAWLDAKFDRALGSSVTTSATISLSRRGGAAMKELAEFIQALDPEQMDPARIAREGAEAVSAVEALFRDAINTVQSAPQLKRVG
ncbi:MAG TPA: hypothetical protein VFU06_00080, partial [Longimicrobiales bacterium]|nr:hypothetical protein [Longimicrobiales bacterium]